MFTYYMTPYRDYTNAEVLYRLRQPTVSDLSLRCLLEACNVG